MESQFSSVGELASFIALQTGRRGLKPPTPPSLEGWYRRLGEAGRLTREGVKQLLEVHYGQDFGARTKLVLVVSLESNYPHISRYLLKRKAEQSGKAVVIGKRMYIAERDVEGVYGKTDG